MSDKNASAEVCQDAAVTKHDYQVTITHTMGGTILRESVQAGSQAHAALQVGMVLLAQLMLDGGSDEVSMHNILDHVIVDVQLIV